MHNSNLTNTQQVKTNLVQLSLTKQDIEDPFQLNQQRMSRRYECSGLGLTSTQGKGFNQLRSIPRSPNMFSSCDKGQVFIVNRQEEDLIKKIDFRQDCQLYVGHEMLKELNFNNNEVNLNISNLFGEINDSFNAGYFRECNETEGLINVPH